ncbi:MAG TPA: hypothetical protein VF609_15110 [Flavisolibacter sp.]|jgi:hypothetical protein
MKPTLIRISGAFLSVIFSSCSAAGDHSRAKDSTKMPSAFDSMKTPVHPGIVDSTGTPQTHE